MTKIEGLQKTIDALRNMGKLETKPIKTMLRREGAVIIRDAKTRCKYDTVKKAIGFITKNESRFPTISLIGIDSKKYGTPTITVAPLAKMLEYGSAPRYTKKGAFRGQIHAAPFMRPAFDVNKDRVNSNIKKGLIQIVEQQAKKNNIK